MTAEKPLNYKDAGVDIDAGEALVQRIKPLARQTRRSGVLGGIGGFGGLFRLDVKRYPDPVLVAGTDGVGTKLKLAIELGTYHTVGIDLVAMCANDVVVQGAEPLFFLDYYATGCLSVEAAACVINGIVDGCREAGIALLGGETAEMPGMYRNEDFDLAGFCVGVVNHDQLIDGSRVKAGDRLIGLAASGPHSNGYSLIRHILAREPQGLGLTVPWTGQTLGEYLLTPTRIYVKALLALMGHCPINALAHITGGGLPGNVNRVLSQTVDAVIDPGSWIRPPIFQWLQERGKVSEEDMYRTFNCGIGMVAIVDADKTDKALEALTQAGEVVSVIGQVCQGSGRVRMAS